MASAIEFPPDFTADAPTTESVASGSGAAGASRSVTARELIDVGLSYLRGHPALLFWASAASVVAGAGLAMLYVARAPILLPS